MKALWLLMCLVPIAPAHAGDSLPWKFIFITRSTDFWVRSGSGTIEIGRGRLSGKLIGDGDVEFYFNGRIKNGKVTAHFGAVESDDGGTVLTGSLRQVADPGSGTCWQTMQLTDGFSSLSLARNAPRCEP